MGELEDMMKKVLSSPEDMSRIMQLAQSLSGNSDSGGDGGAQSQAAPAESGSGLDPDIAALMGRIMRGISAADSGGDKSALIAALKPYLRADRRSKIDRAMKIARIAKIASTALGEMGGNDLGL